MIQGFFSDKVSGKVKTDGIQPREESLAWVKTVQLLISLEKGFLGQVGRSVGRTHHPIHEIENGLLVAHHEGTECVHFSAQNPVNAALFVFTVHAENIIVVTSAAGFSPSLRACPATRLETWLRRMAVYHIRYTWQCTFWSQYFFGVVGSFCVCQP
jgi:hypothetical protein